MTDHTWAQEQFAAAIADDLPTEDGERLNNHVRACPECAAALADVRRLDQDMRDLFADVRPSPWLEDRVVQALRTTRPRRCLLTGWPRRLLSTAAVLMVLVTFGALASALVSNGRLPLPGNVGSSFQWAQRTAAPESMPVPALASSQSGVEGQFPEKGGNSSPMPLEAKQSPRGGGLGGFGGGGFGGFGGGGLGGFGGSPNGKALASPGGGQPAVAAARVFLPPSIGQPNASIFYSFWFRPSDLKPKLPPVTEQPPWASSLPGLGNGTKPKDMPTDLNGALPPPGTSQPTGTAPKPSAPAPPRQVVIRSGNIDFEVESFDVAVATITKLVIGIKGAFVATVNSEKLPNGKVKGSLVVRVPPEALDSLVLDLRKELGKIGELKGERIGSEDITKQYTDLASRLKAARTMEQRLLQIIKEGKGEIKQLLEAEKELGVWRTRIEEFEGELRYYNNLVALSTLTITLAEREIRAAASITESERVQTGIEVEDVEKAREQASQAIAAAKGRITKSELKQLAAGQFNATLNFVVPPDAAGPLLDRLHQIGRMARLEIDRVQTATGSPVPSNAKVTRGDAQFFVQLYNLANVTPRETAVLQVAVEDVPASYRALRSAIAKARARILTARLDEQDRQNVTGQLDFEVRRADEPAVQAALAAAGEVVSRNVGRAPEGDNFTDAKVLFKTTLLGTTRLKPRETATLTIEVPDVDASTAVFAAQVAEVKGRQVDVQVTRDRSGQVTAKLIYDVPLSAASALVEKIKAAGIVRVSQTVRDPQAPDGRYATARLNVTLTSVEQIVAANDGLWPQIRRGLSFSATVLLTSVTWVVFGLCVVLPWAVVGFGSYRLVRRLARSTPPRATAV